MLMPYKHPQRNKNKAFVRREKDRNCHPLDKACSVGRDKLPSEGSNSHSRKHVSRGTLSSTHVPHSRKIQEQQACSHVGPLHPRVSTSGFHM